MESLAVFDAREARYQLPANGTPEEAVRAALKSWRDPARFALAGYQTASGRALPLRTAFALDVARLADALGEPYVRVIDLYFRTERGGAGAQYGSPDVARDLGICGAAVCAGFYVDAWHRPHCRAGHARQVGQWMREGVKRIIRELWPELDGGTARRGMEGS